MSYKLYFRYGTMNSNKTTNLLMLAHNYISQNKKVLLVKPIIDNKICEDIIKCRLVLEKKADVLIDYKYNLLGNIIDYSKYNIVLVDEVQFLTEKQIEQLRIITLKVPVICYGLKSDYKTHLFPGSKRLIELADNIEEIKTICVFCNQKSNINLKYSNGKIIKYGSDEIEIGSKEKYISSCWKCWYENDNIKV